MCFVLMYVIKLYVVSCCCISCYYLVCYFVLLCIDICVILHHFVITSGYFCIDLSCLLLYSMLFSIDMRYTICVSQNNILCILYLIYIKIWKIIHKPYTKGNIWLVINYCVNNLVFLLHIIAYDVSYNIITYC